MKIWSGYNFEFFNRIGTVLSVASEKIVIQENSQVNVGNLHNSSHLAGPTPPTAMADDLPNSISPQFGLNGRWRSATNQAALHRLPDVDQKTLRSIEGINDRHDY